MGSRDPGVIRLVMRGVLVTLPAQFYVIKKTKGLRGEYQFAGADADWRGESAFAVDGCGGAAHLLTLGGCRIMKPIITALFCFVIQFARAGDLQVDEKLAQNAVAVVRVKLMFADSGLPNSPFRIYSVHTISILKNESHDVFRDLLVRGFKDRPGVPEGVCTIYLQRYDPINKKLSDDKDHGLWILVGGDATNGVSNVSMEE